MTATLVSYVAHVGELDEVRRSLATSGVAPGAMVPAPMGVVAPVSVLVPAGDVQAEDVLVLAGASRPVLAVRRYDTGAVAIDYELGRWSSTLIVDATVLVGVLR